MMELDGCVEGDSWRNELESGRVSRVERVDREEGKMGSCVEDLRMNEERFTLVRDSRENESTYECVCGKSAKREWGGERNSSRC